MRMILALMFIAAVSTPALANLKVQFDEGAPKDRFTITNVGSCALGAAKVSIDLSGSPYGLIFDTTNRGAGVQVFQPFELTDGRERLVALPVVEDGDNLITLDLTGLAIREFVSFTIDVDDTVNNREITVADAEIAGAKVIMKTETQSMEATFENDATATLPTYSCTF